MLRLLPYGGDVEHAKAEPLAQQVDGLGFAIAMLWAVLAAAAAAYFVPGGALLAAALAVAAVTAWMARWLRRRLGGYTGGALGATQQCSELVVYLAVLAALAHGGVIGG